MQSHYDLLKNPINLVWAVNCVVEEDSLRVGALYLEPNIPTPIIRLSYQTDHIEVVLPDEYLRSSDSMRAWNVELPIHNPSV